MTHGGARQGAGRKASTPDTTAVHWRVSKWAKMWMKEQAMAQGVSIATILDELIKSFDPRSCMTINELKARLKQCSSDEEKGRLLIEHQELLKTAEQVANWLPDFNPIKGLCEIIEKITKKGLNQG